MICVTSTLNLRPGMNAVAFFTYIIKSSDLNLVSFMSYTLNKKPPCMGLVRVGPHDGLAP